MKTEPAVPAPKKILVIDDNPIIQRAVYFALRDKGYKVLMSGDVTGALKIIRREKPDLIVVDLSFPMDASNIGGPLQDGFFVIERIRRTPELENTPILIVSGTEPAKYKDQAAAAGVKACFHKPLNKEELVAAVQSIFLESTGSQPGQFDI
ncbi:MAG TPA: response regulator [Candidatus Aquilonibacter sp.]|nr:response regulator [Candidatus Aquilonibacter sp.]